MSANRNINYQTTFKNNVILEQLPKTTNGNGAVAGSGVSVVEYGDGITHRSVFTFDDAVVTLADEPGVTAYGGLKFYDFPGGVLNIIRAVANLTLTRSAGGVIADWEGDFGVGTALLGNNAALATTEQDIIPTTATPAASAGVAVARGFSTATEDKIHDGTGTAKDAFLNILIDDADQDVTSTPTNMIVNGTIVIDWSLPLDW